MSGIDEGAKECLALKTKTVVRIGEPFEPIAFVVPIVDGEETRAVGDEMLALGPKSVSRKLAEAAHIRSPEKARRSLKTFGRVLVHHVVFDFACGVFEPIVERRPAFVRTIEEVRGARESLK